MRDQTTAEIGLRAAITGHMVLSTLHTNDAVGTPIRLLDMGVPRYMVAMSLQLVVAQRLLRVNCDNCLETHEPSPQEMAWLRAEIPDGLATPHFSRGRGCSHCNGTGFKGRIGIFEMLEMTGRVVEAASKDDPAAFARAAREQMAGQTLKRDAIRLVVAGRTTAEEAMRVSNELEDCIAACPISSTRDATPLARRCPGPGGASRALSPTAVSGGVTPARDQGRPRARPPRGRRPPRALVSAQGRH